MPFIRGRYHINPVLGEALEAAREAEASLLALEQKEESLRPTQKRPPLHRLEIEAAELVPSHSGRRQRGYVARVHREASGVREDSKDSFAAERMGETNLGAAAKRGQSHPETHVFSNDRELVDFLRSELGSENSD